MTGMTALQQWECCPEYIDFGDRKQTVRLLRQKDRYAVRGNSAAQELGEVEIHLPGDDISIIRGTPPLGAASDYEILPVYASAKDSTPAVVTQRIFVRLEENTPFDRVRESVEALNFRIDDIPAHAPHCAWLEPESGRVDDSLSKLALLRALPRVVNAEPQVLRPRIWKHPQRTGRPPSSTNSEN